MTNTNFINGKQYPYGFKNWLRTVAYIVSSGKNTSPYSHLALSADDWLIYFMDGLSPQQAVKEDSSNA